MPHPFTQEPIENIVDLEIRVAEQVTTFLKADHQNKSEGNHSFSISQENLLNVIDAKVQSISDQGVMVVQFSHEVKKVELVRPEDIGFELEASYEIEETQKIDLTFDWEVVELGGKQMVVKFNFSKPSDISMELKRDSMFVRFKNRTLVTSAEGDKRLKENYYLISGILPRQMPNDLMTVILKQSSEAVEGILQITQIGSAIGISFFAFASLNFLLGSINNLQIIII